MDVDNILLTLKKNGNTQKLENMSKFGISIDSSFGVTIPFLRKLAKEYKPNHQLALNLWETGFREARILASMIDDPILVTEQQMNSWVKDFNSWDLCDQTCNNLFCYTRLKHTVIFNWCYSKEEFVKRAGFVMIAVLAVHDKKAENIIFEKYLSIIATSTEDERNFVKKAVNWSLRQIGKRNAYLNGLAIDLAKNILVHNSKTARWIAGNALSELTGDKIQKKFEGTVKQNNSTILH